MKTAVFSCKGLGDGLIALVVSNNLQRNGDEVSTFHPFLSQLQSWFPHLPLLAFPSLEKLAYFDRYIIIYEKTPWMQEVLAFCERNYPMKTFVLNPIATTNRDYPYWEIGKFDGKRTFAHNLMTFCADGLKVQKASMENGITLPNHICKKKYPKRVIFHPTSSRPGKNWPESKFIETARLLKDQNYDPIFILSKEEKNNWPSMPFSAPEFDSLSDVADFIAESGGMIGNDSGIGHLASSLGLPTVTICRSKMTSDFWRPAWAPNKVVLPPPYLPNLKGLRLRDKYWKQAISVSKVLKNYFCVISE